MTFKKFQGLGQCLGGHHKLVKNSLFLTNWSPVLLEKRHLFRTFHSLQFCCLVVALTQKNSRATWLFYCYFILLGPQGVSQTPKKDPLIYGFFLYTKLDYWWTIGGTFFMTTFIQIWPWKKWRCFTSKIRNSRDFQIRFWVQIRDFICSVFLT